MKFVVPDFYPSFTCIADKCKDSCCVGWEIDIDDDTYAYYKELPGKFGEWLNSHLYRTDRNSFRLVNKRCPMLDEKGLCEIIKELGEESLCEICTEYPRFTFTYGEYREKCLAVSCEEVNRLLFSRKDSVKLTIRETGEPNEEEYWEEEETLYSEIIYRMRNQAIDIIQDQKNGIEERIFNLLEYARVVQDWMNQPSRTIKEADEIISKDWSGEYKKAGLYTSEGRNKRKNLMVDRLRLYGELEVLDKQWKEIYRGIKKMFFDEGFDYDKKMDELKENHKTDDIIYEHLIGYFIFRYGAKSIFDFDFLSKIKMAIVSFLTIRDMQLYWYLTHDKKLSLEDDMYLIRVYSKEVEHSEENLEILTDFFHFESCMMEKEIKSQI